MRRESFARQVEQEREGLDVCCCGASNGHDWLGFSVSLFYQYFNDHDTDEQQGQLHQQS